MSFTVEVNTLGGNVFQLKAKEDWPVWKLKDEIAKVTGAAPNLQRLISLEGCEIQEGKPLMDYCCDGEETIQICLAKMSKSKEDLEWLERWHKITPPELQMFSRKVMDSAYFWPQGWGGGNSHPTKVLRPAVDEEKPQTQESPTIETGAGVLAFMRKKCRGRRRVNSIFIAGRTVFFGSGRYAGDNKPHKFFKHTEQTATLQAVIDAIDLEPAILLECPEVDSSHLVEVVLAALKQNPLRRPSLYSELPQYLMEDRQILYAALELDTDLKEEFIHTADKKELHEWRKQQWDRDDGWL
jgi:hypothetical protein